MTTQISVNGKIISVPDDAEVKIVSKIFIDGQEVLCFPGNENLKLLTVEGRICNLVTDRNVQCDSVEGNLVASGNVSVKGSVKGNVGAEGNVECSSVEGNVKADGNVSVNGQVGGNVSAEGNVKCHSIGGFASAEGNIIGISKK